MLDDGLEITGSRGGTLVADLPHPRADCPVHPLRLSKAAKRTVRGNEKHCRRCFSAAQPPPHRHHRTGTAQAPHRHCTPAARPPLCPHAAAVAGALSARCLRSAAPSGLPRMPRWQPTATPTRRTASGPPSRLPRCTRCAARRPPSLTSDETHAALCASLHSCSVLLLPHVLSLALQGVPGSLLFSFIDRVLYIACFASCDGWATLRVISLYTSPKSLLPNSTTRAPQRGDAR